MDAEQEAKIDAMFERMATEMRERWRHRPSEIIAADEAEQMDDREFNAALWDGLIGTFHPTESPEVIAAWPETVRAYFATRLFEFEAAWSGLASTLDDLVRPHFDEVEAGYNLLGLPESAALVRAVAANEDDDEALRRLELSLEGPPWNGVPWGCRGARESESPSCARTETTSVSEYRQASFRNTGPSDSDLSSQG
jgi:hypothetical protein